MDVIDNAPHGSFLLSEGDQLFLDINCNHNAFGYSVLLELSETERADLETHGRPALDELAAAVQDSAPILENSHSPYRDRDLEKSRGHEVFEAVYRWRKAQRDTARD